MTLHLEEDASDGTKASSYTNRGRYRHGLLILLFDLMLVTSVNWFLLTPFVVPRLEWRQEVVKALSVEVPAGEPNEAELNAQPPHAADSEGEAHDPCLTRAMAEDGKPRKAFDFEDLPCRYFLRLLSRILSAALIGCDMQVQQMHELQAPKRVGYVRYKVIRYAQTIRRKMNTYRIVKWKLWTIFALPEQWLAGW
ncbi:hypothetical protein AVEN_271909-1 [Araneus ventricosus]|uniref:Uncharacterized protein n=1 Tax=Araneus ventricosus TaxID=182803 RepID=A0A4Y2CEA1_ARAVE|nr:hypothetical protein AVEN_271909-1 [Araneus ventricosus]